MRKRLLFITLLAFVAVLAVLLLFREREPKYEGKPLSYWTGLYFVGPRFRVAGREQRERADEAVRRIGTNSIPYLLEWFEAKGHGRWSVLEALYGRLPSALRRFELAEKLLAGRRMSERRSAAAFLALSALGSQAGPAIPELVRMVRDTNSSQPLLSMRATELLTHIGKDAVPALTAIAKDSGCPMEVRDFVIDSLPDLGTNAYLAVPTLLELLTDPELNFVAAEVLMRMANTNAPSN